MLFYLLIKCIILYLCPLLKVKNDEMPLRLQDSKVYKVLIINYMLFVFLCLCAFVAKLYISELTLT